MPFGTAMTKLKLFHVVEKKMYHAEQTFEISCHLWIRQNFDIWFNEDTIVQTSNS